MNPEVKNKGASIAIIGAGPSGLYTAEALREKGYTNVTVFEKQGRVGGMALSRTYNAANGRKLTYELGSVQPFSSHKLFKLIEELGLHLGIDPIGDGRFDRTMHLRSYDSRKRSFISDFLTHRRTGQPLRNLPALLQDVFKLLPWIIRCRNLKKPGYVQDIPPEIYATTEAEWLKARRFKLVSPALESLFSAVLYGACPEKANDPRSLLHSLKVYLFSLNSPKRYSVGLFMPVREGYQEVLNRLAKRHRVMLRAEISAIVRHGPKVNITVNGEPQGFDHVIIACPPNRLLPVLDASVEETTIFEKIQNRPTWRVSFLAKGIRDPLSAWAFADHVLYPDTLPSIRSMSCQGCVEGEGSEATRLYSAIIALDQLEGIDEAILRSERILRASFDATSIQWIDRIFWSQYNSHFHFDDVRNGIYPRFESLQGKNRTYFTGEYLSGNSHSLTLEYSYDLVNRYFS